MRDTMHFVVSSSNRLYVPHEEHTRHLMPFLLNKVHDLYVARPINNSPAFRVSVL